MEQNKHIINDSLDEMNKQTNKSESVTIKKSNRIRKPKRTVIVEPLMVNLMLFSFAYSQVSQLYNYNKIKAYTAHQTGYNMSLESVSNNSNASSCDVDTSSPEYKFTQKVQQNATYFGIVSSLVESLPAIIVMILLGGYSDKCGRKYALVPPILGGFIYISSYLLIIVMDLPLWCVWISNFVYGCTGGSHLMFIGVYSYLADITTKEERFFRITLAELLSFLCGILGPIGVGYWIKEQGYIWPLAISVAGHLLNVVYAVFFVPETIIKDTTTETRLFSTEHFKRTASVFTLKTSHNRRWKLFLLLAVFIFHEIGSSSRSLDSLFELNIPLCWGSVIIGYYSTLHIGVTTIGGIIFAKLFKCCLSDAVIALIAAIFDTMRSIYYGFIKNTLMMFLSTAFSPIGMLLTPTTRTLMSTLVEEDEQGSIFGAIGVVESVIRIVGSEVFKLIYANTLYISTTFAFFLGGIFYFIVIVLMLIYICGLRREKIRYQELKNIEEKEI